MKVCKKCGADLAGKHLHALFCSVRCRVARHRDKNYRDEETFTFRANLRDLGDRLAATGRLAFHLRHDKDAIEDVLREVIQESLE